MPFSVAYNHQPSLLDDLPNAFLQQICLGLQTAVEVDLPQSRSKLDVDTHNHERNLRWDLIYTNALRNRCLSAFPSKSCSWDMALIHEKVTNFLIGLMTEKRFAELQAKQSARRKMHYIDVFARSFNLEQKSAECQLSLFPKEFADEEIIEERAASLLQELGVDVKCLRHFALVLFDARGDQLLSVRIVLVDPDLNVVAEHKLNSMLSHEVSPIVETVPVPETPAQNPGRNLVLKSKAQQRKKNGLRPKLPRESEESDTPET